MMTDYAAAIREMIGYIDSEIPEFVAYDRVLEMRGHNLTEGQKGALYLIAKNWQGQRMVDGLDDMAKDRELEELRAAAAAGDASIYAK